MPIFLAIILKKHLLNQLAGGTSTYISQKSSYKLRKDLDMYSSEEIESIFVEILVPYKQNLIVGTIYKNPPMKPHKFCNKFMKLQSKLKNQNKILSGDLNLNLLGYNKKPENHLFLEGIFTNNFFPQIILPTRVTRNSAILIGKPRLHVVISQH